MLYLVLLPVPRRAACNSGNTSHVTLLVSATIISHNDKIFDILTTLNSALFLVLKLP